MHTVAILALDGVLAFDLSTPVEVFGRARLPDGRRAYAVRVCAPTGEVDANHPVERISRQVGFNSPASFRGQFKALVGTSPQTYRRAFQGSDQIVH